MGSVVSSPHYSVDDYRFMANALRLAKKGVYTTHPNPRVGCILVKNGNILSEGWHEIAGQAHAEIVALQLAGKQSRGATAYVTLEPCAHHGRTPPCADALVQAGVKEVIIAMQDPNPLVAGQGISKLEQAGIKVKCGLLEQQAEELNRGFVSRMKSGRPWVTLKLGASIDGRSAMKSGESKWITGAEARQDVQRLRAASSADSFIKFAKSAPVKPGVLLATASICTSSSKGIFLAYTSRILALPVTSGGRMLICRSNLPGLSNEGSRTSGRLIAPTPITVSPD